MGKPSIIANIKAGAALAAVNGIRETLNWVFKWVSNFELGAGLEWEKDGKGDNPKVKVDIEAGDGIEVEESGNALKISATGGKLSVTGTDGGKFSGDSVVFASAADSSVKAVASESNGTITVTLGVYYT